MAAGSKKRRPSRSHGRSGSSKKTRQASTAASVRSQRGCSGPQPSRAKSVFREHCDPYCPPSNKGSVSLPTGDDYVFRVQVISTTSHVNTDVFKKAVQGLVKTCFPQDVLEEIGIDVVTQHMRSEGAPHENITKMNDILRSEMIHCVTWMLAAYLDTPAKVEASVKALMAASASLHGAKVGEDVLGDITTSLQALGNQISNSSTERLGNSTDMESLSCRVIESDTTDSGVEQVPESKQQAQMTTTAARKTDKTAARLNSLGPVRHTRLITYEQDATSTPAYERLSSEISRILVKRRGNEMMKRGLLERVLRRAAFCYKDDFAELKLSPLVKAWERVTGLSGNIEGGSIIFVAVRFMQL